MTDFKPCAWRIVIFGTDKLAYSRGLEPHHFARSDLDRSPGTHFLRLNQLTCQYPWVSCV